MRDRRKSIQPDRSKAAELFFLFVAGYSFVWLLYVVYSF